ncbi:MAG: DUF1559 domain-containing protein [Thermoguttaceae bacterium]|nr:DUF1559 domain-containing protein [Thermoguttaceae bacterium]
MRRNLLAALAPVFLGAALFAAAPTLAPSAFAQDANQPPAAPSAAQLRSLRNLKQLALAAQNFYDRHMSLPAHYSVDANGKPLHSWRVFLLPFIEQNELYKQIRLDEPWDSEHNRQFHSKAPEIFRRPGSSDPGCVYSCVVDKTAALQPAKEPGSQLGFRLGAFIDGTMNTVLFVERKESVCWMDPNVDLTLDEFLATVADAPDAVPAVFVDGRAALLPKSSEPSVLKAYVTRAGGEIVPQPPVAPALEFQAAALKTQSINNLKQITLATHNFADAHKSAFPARYSVDADGKPLHSWRVFLLPFVEQGELYKQIRLDEPWDSEHNRQFHSKTPKLFRRPGSDDKGCVYVCVASERAALQPAKESGSQLGARIASFTDGVSNTILYVERKEPVCWMDPNADLTLDEFLKNVAEGSAYRDGGTNVSLVDGRALVLRRDADPTFLKAAITRNGGEEIDFAPFLARVQGATQADWQARSLDNLRRLALAAHNFYDLNMSLPARCSVDADGAPLHSWRVFLLPYLGQNELYKKIRLDEPWDSEHNRQFHDQTPAIFCRPGSKVQGCVYACVADETAALQPAKEPGSRLGIRFADIPDGSTNTLLFVERKEPVCWMDPNADLTLDEFLKNVADAPGAVPAAFADGRAALLPSTLSPSFLKACVTRNGGDALFAR